MRHGYEPYTIFYSLIPFRAPWIRSPLCLKSEALPVGNVRRYHGGTQWTGRRLLHVAELIRFLGHKSLESLLGSGQRLAAPGVGEAAPDGGGGGLTTPPQPGSAASMRPSQSSSKPLRQSAPLSTALLLRQIVTTALASAAVRFWRTVRPDAAW